jgi:hypothetical protein
MPGNASDTLRWNAPEIAKIMARKHIPHREALAKEIGKPATSVRRSFDEDWEGDATAPLMIAISRTFWVPFHKLIRDPRHYK